MAGHGPSWTADERECAEGRAAPVVRPAEVRGGAGERAADAGGGSGESGLVGLVRFPRTALPSRSTCRERAVTRAT